ncbi:hypothetical protein RHMOL_Rhmol03G0063700 [Rhododendron molle]|uniref:Uncharacterized protein n=1 Tax=Rhododendron molle TaxID=49168 RepID=A0ACC0PCQ3_RHOML|nr:hypothetical protein RHMOL_Rhmol03G0063700 [Rhododendron molle]
MKFGEAFIEYVNGNQERFTDKCSHIEYKRLKKVLKSCRACRGLRDSCPSSDGQDEHGSQALPNSEICQCEACPLCDQMFFSELMKEASEMAGFFSSRVRHLLHLHIATGMQRYMVRLRRCFKDDHQAMVQEGHMLIEYVTMNAIALRKILKKYDKVHRSVNGRNFKSKMRAKHVEILQSPWLIELGAFYMNCDEPDGLKAANPESKCPVCREDCNEQTIDPIIIIKEPESLRVIWRSPCNIVLEFYRGFSTCAARLIRLFQKNVVLTGARASDFEVCRGSPLAGKCSLVFVGGDFAEGNIHLHMNILLKGKNDSYERKSDRAYRPDVLSCSNGYRESCAITVLI